MEIFRYNTRAWQALYIQGKKRFKLQLNIIFGRSRWLTKIQLSLAEDGSSKLKIIPLIMTIHSRPTEMYIFFFHVN